MLKWKFEADRAFSVIESETPNCWINSYNLINNEVDEIIILHTCKYITTCIYNQHKYNHYTVQFTQITSYRINFYEFDMMSKPMTCLTQNMLLNLSAHKTVDPKLFVLRFCFFLFMFSFKNCVPNLPNNNRTKCINVILNEKIQFTHNILQFSIKIAIIF